MGGRALLVVVTGIILISGAIFLNITRSSADISENADRNYQRQVSQNIAQSGVNLALRQLAAAPAWRAGFAQKDLFGGKVSVTARDTTFNSGTVVKITSISVLDQGLSTERRDTSIAYVTPPGGGFIPPGIKGAITSNYEVSPQAGVLIDGRDHDSTGVFVPVSSGGTGTLGVWSLGKFTIGGTSTIGGSFGGVDYTPTKAPGGTIVNQSQTWPNGGTYPTSPDAVMGGTATGFSDGQLKRSLSIGMRQNYLWVRYNNLC